MKLSPNQIFHNRYLLVEQIGSGASAEVWKALDTKAGNLAVALKIYTSDITKQGSYGLSVFQKEFTTVFNMTHTNLLRPSGYDIYEGCPYLIMQFCENGSAASMVGRTDEKDLLHVLHDVSAGLEYLHDHNIIHQDIKPDNILVDDNCNFLVTDFGISKKENTADSSIGGTRAYMAPEVYAGKTSKESDIWSLGATAVELLTGNPPFGENGGLAEAQGTVMENLPDKLQPQVKRMIISMLDENPIRRPSASQIRRSIELYQETGSWTRKSNRNIWIYIATSILSVAICTTIFLWDYNRVKVRYYKDYVELFGVPHGIGRVSIAAQKHRQYTFKFECQRGKVHRISTINSHGKIDRLTETEFNDKYVDAEFFYNSDGGVDYMKVYDQSGKCLYKLDYDENLRTAIFKQDDEFGTEKTLRSNTTDSYANSGVRSSISRYKLTYDNKGRVIKREYAGFQNVDLVDEDMIHGMLYKYDDKNRVKEIAFIGLDGEIRGNKKGLAIKLREYDDNDNLTKISYLTSERTPSHDGNNVAIVKYGYDKYGNTVNEFYFDADNNPGVRTDVYVHGYEYKYDDAGHRVKSTNIGVDGKPSFTNVGYVSEDMEYDVNGYICKIKFLDDNDELVDISTQSANYANSTYKNDEHGNPLEVTLADKLGNHIEAASGVWRTVYTYDSIGNVLGESYFNKNDRPTTFYGYQSSVKVKYDNFSREIERAYFDADGKPTVCGNGYHKIVREYNSIGNTTSITYLGKNDKPIKSNERFAKLVAEYDEMGNITSIKLLDEKENLTLGSDGFAYTKTIYDPSTNLAAAYYTYDVKGNQVDGRKFSYDKRGNLTELRYVDEDGNLQEGTVVENYVYDEFNREISRFYTDSDGKKVNLLNSQYNEIKYKYDGHGNCVNISFWDKEGNPSYNANKTHKIIKEFDSMDNVVYWKELDVKGEPNTSDSNDNNPEVKYKYDTRGNRIEYAIYDGYSKPTNGKDGWHKVLSTYNSRNQVLTTEYRDLNNKLVKSKEVGYAKEVTTYDSRGNRIKTEDYDESKLTLTTSYKLNSKEQIIEVVWTYPDGKIPTDKLSKITIEYESDSITPKKTNYFDYRGKISAYQTYDKDKGEWSDYVFPNSGAQRPQPSQYSNSSDLSWQDEWRDLARRCPMEIENGAVLQSVSMSSYSVSVTLRLINVSKYELSSSDMADVNNIKESYKAYFKDFVPSSVAVYVYIQDKAGRTL